MVDQASTISALSPAIAAVKQTIEQQQQIAEVILEAAAAVPPSEQPVGGVTDSRGNNLNTNA